MSWRGATRAGWIGAVQRWWNSCECCVDSILTKAREEVVGTDVVSSTRKTSRRKAVGGKGGADTFTSCRKRSYSVGHVYVACVKVRTHAPSSLCFLPHAKVR